MDQDCFRQIEMACYENDMTVNTQRDNKPKGKKNKQNKYKSY